ncbi:hypothetical protein E2C01_084306 [Portunus trituberculatus]|uniref:Uncharacterized protein n=1 Tax=Portunus trituberculatus TaxID=210409 RepID=A0A5B7JAD2_PORTR|nr:hypothetical protein [Portunus trituberculatus]
MVRRKLRKPNMALFAGASRPAHHSCTTLRPAMPRPALAHLHTVTPNTHYSYKDLVTLLASALLITGVWLFTGEATRNIMKQSSPPAHPPCSDPAPRR